MGRITRESHITYYSIMFLLDTLVIDKCMCLQGELKLQVTCPAGQVQDKCNVEIFLSPVKSFSPT